MHLIGEEMPTSKPRITITLTEGQRAVLSSLAELQHVSMSSIIIDLLETTMPALERLEVVLDHSRHASEKLMEEIENAMQMSGDVLIEGLNDVDFDLSQLDMLEIASVGDVRKRAPADAISSASKKAGPPTSIRGVRITTPRSKIDSISPMKTSKKIRGVKK